MTACRFETERVLRLHGSLEFSTGSQTRLFADQNRLAARRRRLVVAPSVLAATATICSWRARRRVNGFLLDRRLRARTPVVAFAAAAAATMSSVSVLDTLTFTLLSVIFVPFLMFFLGIVLLAHVGKSLGIQRVYVEFLLKVFEVSVTKTPSRVIVVLAVFSRHA